MELFCGGEALSSWGNLKEVKPGALEGGEARCLRYVKPGALG